MSTSKQDAEDSTTRSRSRTISSSSYYSAKQDAEDSPTGSAKHPKSAKEDADSMPVAVVATPVEVEGERFDIPPPEPVVVSIPTSHGELPPEEKSHQSVTTSAHEKKQFKLCEANFCSGILCVFTLGCKRGTGKPWRDLSPWERWTFIFGAFS